MHALHASKLIIARITGNKPTLVARLVAAEEQELQQMESERHSAGGGRVSEVDEADAVDAYFNFIESVGVVARENLKKHQMIAAIPMRLTLCKER